MSPSRSRRPRLSVRLAALALVLLAGFGIAEWGARLALGDLEGAGIPGLATLANRSLMLNPYQRASADHPRHWELVPGYHADAATVIAAKRADGRVEAEKALRAAEQVGVPLAPLDINDDGFKGPPLDPRHEAPRILVIGDSVVFGLMGLDIPRVLDEALARAGFRWECVNAGVEGYASRNALLELPRYRALRPDTAVILLGWNDLFAEDGSHGTLLARLRSATLLRKAWGTLSALGADPVAQARAHRDKAKHPDPAAPEIARFSDWGEGLEQRLEQLGDGLAAGGSRVALATLPGLYRNDQPFDRRALEIGHLPEFTDNPHVLAAMTDSANRRIRALAMRKGWQVLDLDAWSRDALQPRSAYFSDSVHPDFRAIRMMGLWLAERLADSSGTGRSE